MFSQKIRIAIFLLVAGFFSCEDDSDIIVGPAGQDGLNSIISTEPEAAGANCENGGIRVSYGLDLNRNNILEETEIENFDFVCNGVDGLNGFNTLMNSDKEVPGENCASGGIKISYGLDVDRSNYLEQNEVENSYYICNGENGLNGLNPGLSSEIEPAGINCEFGGVKINYGLDLNSNSFLDSAEVKGSYYICNGEEGTNGLNSIISSEIESAGVNCESGGIKINYGLDLNENNNLEANEIERSEFLCNDSDGSFTINELDNLIKVQLGSPNVRTCGNAWFISEYNSFHYPDFNKLDYSNVSSIEFVPTMVSQSENNVVTVELFNMTDSVVIAGTRLKHNTSEYVYKYSEDIYDALPDYPITLGIRMRNRPGENKCGGLGIRSYLYIRRD